MGFQFSNQLKKTIRKDKKKFLGMGVLTDNESLVGNACDQHRPIEPV